MTIRHPNKVKGFTLVELITVIIIVAVISIVSASKFFNQNRFNTAQIQQDLLSAFRYAQKIAIASQCPVSIHLGSNNYSLTYATPCSGNVKKPTNQNSYSDNNTSAVISSSSSTFTYDASGNITPSGGGSITIGSFTIQVEALTGFVHD